jgi:hypothetical protein
LTPLPAIKMIIQQILPIAQNNLESNYKDCD